MDTERIREFFFKAMVEGWAAGAQKIKIDEMPGYKAIPFRDGDFYLLDCYCTHSDSPKSAGTTTIWFKEVPVWFMSYGGFYEERAIAFLKRALCKAYEAHEFVSGRGPRRDVEGNLIYLNKPLLYDFAKFDGREAVFILNVEGEVELGFHKYWGMSLF